MTHRAPAPPAPRPRRILPILEYRAPRGAGRGAVPRARLPHHHRHAHADPGDARDQLRPLLGLLGHHDLRAGAVLRDGWLRRRRSSPTTRDSPRSGGSCPSRCWWASWRRFLLGLVPAPRQAHPERSSSSRWARSPPPTRPSASWRAGSGWAPATASRSTTSCRSALSRSSRAASSTTASLAFLVLAYLGSRAIVRSQFGLVLAGMRQNEERLAFLGYRVPAFKALVFAYAGMLAGLAGGLYAHHEGYIGPADLGIALSTFVVLYGLFGGVGTLIGPVIGVLRHRDARASRSRTWTRSRPYWPVLLGVIMLVVVVFQPTGSWGSCCRSASASAASGAPRRPSARTARRHGAPSLGRRAAWRFLRSAASARRFGVLRALDGVDVTVREGTLPRADRAERLGQEHAPEGDRRRRTSPRTARSASTGATSPAPSPPSAPASA